MSSQRRKPSHPLNNDLLVRGVLLVLIGLALLIGPHFMGASPTRELFEHALIPAWFAVVLGAAFVLQFTRQHLKKQHHHN